MSVSAPLRQDSTPPTFPQLNTARSSLRALRPLWAFYARALSAFVALFMVLGSATHLISTVVDSSDTASKLNTNLPEGSSSSSLTHALLGTHVIASDGTEFVHALPPAPREAKATLLLLHGCSHAATDFFPSSSNCPRCIGLPEELRLTRHALENNYAVIAVSPTDRVRSCWRVNRTLPHGSDYTRIETALQASGLGPTSSRPLVAVGVSSGGAFASSLTPRFKVSAVIAIVSTPACLIRPRPVCPPHAFVHMGVRDAHTGKRITEALRVLSRRGLKAKEYLVPPRPVTSKFLTQSITGLSMNLANSIVIALREAKLLDEAYHLTQNPRSGTWRSVLAHLKERLNDSFVADKSALSEELNRAWGGHEITSDYFPDALSYVEGDVL